MESQAQEGSITENKHSKMCPSFPLSTSSSSWSEPDALLPPADYAKFAYLNASRQSVLLMMLQANAGVLQSLHMAGN